MSSAELRVTDRERSTGRSRRERSAMVAAMRRLEDMLGRAAPARSDAWTSDVADALDALRAGMREHVLVAQDQDGLLAEILEQEPRLVPRVEQLRQEYVELERIASMMRDDLRRDGVAQDVATTRLQLRQLLGELRAHQSAESDLIWEAFAVDIGVGD